MTAKKWTLVVVGAALTLGALTLPGAPARAAGPELVVNGGLEQGGSPPSCFQLTGWGTNTYTSAASTSVKHTGARAWKLTMSKRTNGDRKLMVSDAVGCAPAVTPGQKYDVSAWYKSTASLNGLTVFRQTATGWEYWTDLKTLPAVTPWTKVTATTPAVPDGTLRLSYGISIAAVGTLYTDDYSMVQSGTDPPPTGDAVTGRWAVQSYTLASRTNHTTLLRNGKVLLITGSGNEAGAFAAGTFKAEVWDPLTGQFAAVPVPADMWCGGHATLPDGRVLIMGGTASYPDPVTGVNFTGLKNSYVFDPTTNAFTRLNDAQTGHWYPTLTRLGSGDIWAAGGLNEAAEGTVATELFSTAQGRWLNQNEVTQTYSYWGTYPHMILLQDGRLFYTGAHTFGRNIAGSGASLYDITTGALQDVPGLREPQTRDQAGSALLPPAQDQRVAIFGGGDTENNTTAIGLTDVVDLKSATPSYHAAATLPGPGKGYVNTVVLPDRTVLTTGGAQHNRSDDVLTSAIFNPVTETWTAVADNPIPREYHSSAVLLPDGRVVTLGGNPADNSFELRISIYSPPYLFKSARPSITASATSTTYGAQTVVQASGSIQYANLVAPMSVTHQTDPNMRLVDIPFVKNADGSLTLTIPTNRNILPPGPYMLSVTDTSGIPSEARWISVA